MSLNFNLTNCALTSDEIRTYGESVIFHTMFLGVQLQTDNDAEKFFSRYVTWCRAAGVDRFLTLSVVRKFVGLHTNAVELSDAKFWKKVREMLERDAQQILTNELRELENGDDHTCNYACGSAGYCLILG